MEYLWLKNKYQLDEKALISYGFSKDSSAFIFKTSPIENFTFLIKISKNVLSLDVFDEDGEIYIPFTIQQAQGALVSTLKNSASILLEDIIKHCFIPIDIRSNILKYVCEQYGTLPDYPWKEYQEHATLKNEKGKWYGLLAKIPAKCLGLPSNSKIDILNVKLAPEKIVQLIDSAQYYAAYHMNKKYWMTILLNENTDLNMVYKLLDESYQAVNH